MQCVTPYSGTDRRKLPGSKAGGITLRPPFTITGCSPAGPPGLKKNGMFWRIVPSSRTGMSASQVRIAATAFACVRIAAFASPGAANARASLFVRTSNSPHVSIRPPGTTTASLSAKNSAFRRTMSPISIARASGFRHPLRHAVDEQVVVLEEAVADAAVELEAAEQLPDPRLVALAAVAQRH